MIRLRPMQPRPTARTTTPTDARTRTDFYLASIVRPSRAKESYTRAFAHPSFPGGDAPDILSLNGELVAAHCPRWILADGATNSATAPARSGKRCRTHKGTCRSETSAC